MLTILTGRNAAANRAEISGLLLKAAENGGNAVLLVPAQESFIRDRELLLTLGEAARSRFQVTGFSHFARDLLEANDVPVKPEADSAAATVLMSLALKNCAEQLTVFGRHYRRPKTVRALIDAYEAVRQAGGSAEDLQRLSAVTAGTLRRKTRELAVVFAAYETLMLPRFSSDADNVRRASTLLQSRRLFAGTEFFLDDFSSFTAVQMQLLEALLRQTDVTVSLPGPFSDKGKARFEFMEALKNRLQLAAQRAGVRTYCRHVEDPDAGGAFRRLREGLFADGGAALQGAAPEITLTRAANRYAECERIAVQIKELLETGACRARDIAVFIRDPLYMPALTSALKNCGLPVFEDKRRELYRYPPARLLLHAAAVAAKGFSTEELLSLLKTGITNVPEEEEFRLESYVTRWGIDGAAWLSPFKGNPGGFGAESDEASAAALEALNAARETLVAPLKRLRDVFSAGDARENCRALYFYLKEIKADERYRDYARCLAEDARSAEALSCGRAWEACMAALDALAEAAGGGRVDPVYFYELLTLMLADSTLGEIPTGVDEILIGTVERSRVLSPAAVFVAGMNEGFFPAAAPDGGVFTAEEARTLADLDLPVAELPEERYEKEQLYAYAAFTSPSNRLYLSYAAADTAGQTLTPSPFIADVKAALGELNETDAARLDPILRVGSAETAFALYAARYRQNDVITASLRGALSACPGYAGRLQALDRAAAGVGAVIEDRADAVALFGRDLFVSASRAEAYAKCPFAYFCRYGMGVERDAPVSLDVRINGLLVHFALEKLLGSHKGDGLWTVPEETLFSEISAAVSEWVAAYMGGGELLTPAIRRSLVKTERTIREILLRIRSELKDSDFRPADMELAIGGKNADIPAYTLTLPDGGRLSLSGSVDRVDLWDGPDGRYVRVIDYKTGGKEFKLSDVFEGLNMQMLLYLFAVCENGGERYGETKPAGVLYVPAKTGGKNLGRGSSETEVLRQKLENGRMNGVVLEDERVLCAMEHDAKGVYLNAQIRPDGSMKGEFLSPNEFRLLHETTDRILRRFGMDLHGGRVPALPIEEGGKTPCEYCDYAAVCGKEADCEKRTVAALKHEQARQALAEENSQK